MRRSVGWILTSTASTSGKTATVTVEVCTRPWDSVSGTRCTRCTPLSYFIREYTRSPLREKLTSFIPPSSVGLLFITVRCHPCRSAYMEYIRYRDPANKAASSPPAPPRISTITLRSSLGSVGSSMIFICCSSVSISFLAERYCSSANERSSASSPASACNSSASCRSLRHCLYLRYTSTSGVSCLYSRISDAKRAGSDTTEPSCKRASSSSYFCSVSSN